MAIKLRTPEEGFQDRKEMLVALAIAYLRTNGWSQVEQDLLHYDEADCDALCLADDLEMEFQLDDLTEYYFVEDLE